MCVALYALFKIPYFLHLYVTGVRELTNKCIEFCRIMLFERCWFLLTALDVDIVKVFRRVHLGFSKWGFWDFFQSILKKKRKKDIVEALI